MIFTRRTFEKGYNEGYNVGYERGKYEAEIKYYHAGVKAGKRQMYHEMRKKYTTYFKNQVIMITSVELEYNSRDSIEDMYTIGVEQPTFHVYFTVKGTETENSIKLVFDNPNEVTIQLIQDRIATYFITG
ncbi:hypothetical protein [Virgibacillus proomii]|uniref:hypothetical protein n=1 Tax=Virgibacillus proomii TaxID=84407 RepID=UPI001C10197C|nr:hypothetical protein [Virgibacillus proomii]MBU5266230.1 hypothetical protein [Virgibacillus proomii]